MRIKDQGVLILSVWEGVAYYIRMSESYNSRALISPGMIPQSHASTDKCINIIEELNND
jgi:flagellin-specific chaperone FliS